MAKRYTDTNKWGDPGFRNLPPKMKCCWDYVFSKCDQAGFWSPDFEAASFFIGEKVTLEEFKKSFDGKFIMLEKVNRILLLEFLSLQYASKKNKEKRLNPDNKVHMSVISIFNTLAPSMDYDDLLLYPLIDLNKLLASVCIDTKDKEKDKEKDKGKEKQDDSENFNADQAREDMQKLSGIKTPDDLIQYWNSVFVDSGFPPAPFTLGTEYSKKFFNINKRLLENKISWKDYLTEIITSNFLLTRKIGKPAVTWVLDEANFDDVIAGKFKNPDVRAQAVADLHDLELN